LTYFILSARVLLAIVFAVAGFAKLANPKGTRDLAKDFGANESLANLFALLLPLAELACAVLLVPARTAQAGATATLALLVIFIIGISVSLARGKRPDDRTATASDRSSPHRSVPRRSCATSCSPRSQCS
jgi:uncharacterized membrane protein YphA (DoxX/SURF4 family)